MSCQSFFFYFTDLFLTVLYSLLYEFTFSLIYLLRLTSCIAEVNLLCAAAFKRDKLPYLIQLQKIYFF